MPQHGGLRVRFHLRPTSSMAATRARRSFAAISDFALCAAIFAAHRRPRPRERPPQDQARHCRDFPPSRARPARRRRGARAAHRSVRAAQGVATLDQRKQIHSTQHGSAPDRLAVPFARAARDRGNRLAPFKRSLSARAAGRWARRRRPQRKRARGPAARRRRTRASGRECARGRSPAGLARKRA